MSNRLFIFINTISKTIVNHSHHKLTISPYLFIDIVNDLNEFRPKFSFDFCLFSFYFSLFSFSNRIMKIG